jgi:hypothetical protein
MKILTLKKGVSMFIVEVSYTCYDSILGETRSVTEKIKVTNCANKREAASEAENKVEYRDLGYMGKISNYRTLSVKVGK